MAEDNYPREPAAQLVTSKDTAPVNTSNVPAMEFPYPTSLGRLNDYD